MKFKEWLVKFKAVNKGVIACHLSKILAKNDENFDQATRKKAESSSADVDYKK